MSAVNDFDPDTTDLLRNVTLTGYGERTSYIAGPPLSLLFEGARGGYDVKLHAITATRSPRLRPLVGLSFYAINASGREMRHAANYGKSTTPHTKPRLAEMA